MLYQEFIKGAGLTEGTKAQDVFDIVDKIYMATDEEFIKEDAYRLGKLIYHDEILYKTIKKVSQSLDTKQPAEEIYPTIPYLFTINEYNQRTGQKCAVYTGAVIADTEQEAKQLVYERHDVEKCSCLNLYEVEDFDEVTFRPGMF